MIERRAEREAGDQQKDELAGVHVAEQSHRQRQRPDDFLDHAKYKIDGRQQYLERRAVCVKRSSEPLAGEYTEALVRNAHPLDQQKHAERHADRGVEVGRGHSAQMLDTPRSFAAAGNASTGRISMKFSRNTMQKIVMASGAMNLFEP